MAEASAGVQLIQVAALLGAGVVAVPLFRKLGLGSVLGYLAAGLVIGPFGLGLFHEPETILHVAEFGVVIFLFLIGLEMRPKKLWALRDQLVAVRHGHEAEVAFLHAPGHLLQGVAGSGDLDILAHHVTDFHQAVSLCGCGDTTRAAGLGSCVLHSAQGVLCGGRLAAARTIWTKAARSP